MLVGYARVSSTNQDLTTQVEKLEVFGCEKIFQEKVSGTTTTKRDELKQCLDFVREGDKLVIVKLDRLARSVTDLFDIQKQLQAKKVDLVVLDQSLDTSTSTGKLLFGMLGLIAEFENDIRRERQADGILKAKSQGKYLGREKVLDDLTITQIKEEFQSGSKATDLMKKYKLSKATFYRYIKN